MSARWLLVLAAAGLNLGLAVVEAPPARVVLHPVPPPLTRIPAMDGRPLADGPPPVEAAPLLSALARTLDEGPASPDTPALRRRLDAARGTVPRIGGLVEEGARLRAEVQDDAVAIAAVLGPERVAWIVADKEALAASVGEGRVWAEAGALFSGAP